MVMTAIAGYYSRQVRRYVTPNLVPRAFPLKNGWAPQAPHPFFKGKALGTRLRYALRDVDPRTTHCEKRETQHRERRERAQRDKSVVTV